MPVLYRKYRPQSFSEVLNQKPIVQTLQHQVKSGQLAHAYLFTGGRGVGKTSVARILAKAVNCLKPQDGDACGVCENCKAIATGAFLDLVEIDAASNTGVDNIRELIEHVKFSPTSGKYKVFIIDEAHMLSKGAFNALLKTLEEPPKHAMFVLATTEINKLPATIISRTQRFDFKAYSPAHLLELLQKVAQAEGLEFTTEVLELAAQNAQGSARDALSLLEKLLTLGNGASLEDSRQLLGVTDLAVCQNLLELIAQGKAAEIPAFFSQAAEKGQDYLVFNRDFLEFLRKVLVFKISDSRSASDPDSTIGKLASPFSVSELIFIIRLFLKSYKDLPASPDSEIPLLMAAVEAALRKAENLPVGQAGRKVGESESRNPDSASSYLPKPAMGLEAKKNEELREEGLATPELTLAEQETLDTFPLEELQVLWPKVIEKIRLINSPLANLLRTARLQAVEGSKVILGVKFLFNKQNLENSKNFSVICESLKDITGKNMSLAAIVVKESKSERGDTAEVLSDALKVFGGEILD